MWMRLIVVMIQTDKMDDFRKIYNEEIVPTVKAQKGNVHVFLMESIDREGEITSFTAWKTQENGDAYERSGTYVEMVNKVRHTFAGTPTLWSYEVRA
ncbi:antibiotic biosynthesis monooxygenase family protein [Thermodesulfobacteriota bacterium]